MSRRVSRHSLWLVWRMPALLALLTMFGLLAALLGTGAWHWAAWTVLALPIVTGLWHALRRQPVSTLRK